MKTKRMTTALALIGALGLGSAGVALAHGPGMSGERGDMPMMGSGMMMGPGMTGQGYQGQMPMTGYGMMGMGPGMMGNGMMGMGPGMMGGYGCGGMQPLARDLSADEVTHMMEHRVAWARNPNLKVGKVTEKDGDTIEAEIVTKDGSLVRKFTVDRHTGRMQPVE